MRATENLSPSSALRPSLVHQAHGGEHRPWRNQTTTTYSISWPCSIGDPGGHPLKQQGRRRRLAALRSGTPVPGWRSFLFGLPFGNVLQLGITAHAWTKNSSSASLSTSELLCSSVTFFMRQRLSECKIFCDSMRYAALFPQVAQPISPPILPDVAVGHVKYVVRLISSCWECGQLPSWRGPAAGTESPSFSTVRPGIHTS